MVLAGATASGVFLHLVLHQRKGGRLLKLEHRAAFRGRYDTT